MTAVRSPAGSSPVTDGWTRSGMPRLRSPVGVGMVVLLGFTLAALAGFGIFGMHPDRIPSALLGFWGISYAFFAQLHIILGAVVLGGALVRWGGLRWLPAFGAVYGIAFLSEFFGTGYGIPFGLYEYSGLLGAKLGGRVPWVIPLSWFLMAVPAWILARQTFPESPRGSSNRLPRIAFAAVLLTLWDVALDPAMSYQAPYYWTWSDTGPYYGMPWVNLAGWLGTGLVLMAAMEWLGIARWTRRIPAGFALSYYGVTLLMPLGMIVLEGLWIAVLATLVGYAAAWGVYRLSVSRLRAPVGEAG